MQISFNLGKSFIYTDATASRSYEDGYYYEEYILLSPFVPNVLSSSLYFNFKSGLAFKITGGFGFATNSIEYDQPNQTFTTPSGEYEFAEVHTEDTYKIKGFSVEGAMIYPVALDKNEKLLIYPGIGIGYYSYGMSGEWTSKGSEYQYDYFGNYQLVNYTDKGKYEEGKISGFAQSFIFGMEFRITKSTSFILELQKMGFQLLKVSQDEDWEDGDFRRTIGEEKSTQENFPGMVDVGVMFGVKIGL